MAFVLPLSDVDADNVATASGPKSIADARRRRRSMGPDYVVAYKTYVSSITDRKIDASVIV